MTRYAWLYLAGSLHPPTCVRVVSCVGDSLVYALAGTTVRVRLDRVRVRAWGSWRPKDREERDVPVPAAVAELARELVAWRAVAVGVSGKPVKLCDHYALDAIARAWPRTGIAGPSPGMHDARRTFATEMSRRPGVSLRDVQRLLGHSSAATTERYLGRYRSDAARPAVDMGLASVLQQGPLAEVLPLRRGG